MHVSIVLSILQTQQRLTCDCVNSGCNGTFRVSFDGEVSPRLKTWGNSGDDVVDALRNMRTIQAANITVSASLGAGNICVPGAEANHTLVFQAQLGNVPRIGVWSSVSDSVSPAYYSTLDTVDVLRVVTDDGRDDNVKLCNGIGKCDFSSGQCACPFGWNLDADIGPCGNLQVNSSKYAGLARCPGVAISSGLSSDMSGRKNYAPRMYISLNPTYTAQEGAGTASFPSNRTIAGIYVYTWRSDTIVGPSIDESSQKLFLNLTSNSSAGPLLLDATKDRLFFVDQHPVFPYIGIASLRGPLGSSSVWLSVTYRIFGIASDAHFRRRMLYWSVPGDLSDNNADGSIYYASMDDAANPTVYSLVSAIGQVTISHVTPSYT
jgi:hypothetical protein